MAYFMISNYLYTVGVTWPYQAKRLTRAQYLVVAKGESVESATRITSMYSFTSTITAIITGIVVRYVRRLKPFQLAGGLLYILGLGLMIRFRGYNNSRGEIVMTQVILGLGGGLFTYPTQANMQACVFSCFARPDYDLNNVQLNPSRACVSPPGLSLSSYSYRLRTDVATVTAVYLSVFYIGGAIGAAISGAIWTQTLPGKLLELVPGATPELVAEICASFFAVHASYVNSRADGGPFVWITVRCAA